MSTLSRILPAVCAALLCQAAAPAHAEQARQFALPKTVDAEATAGQVDWPSGKLEKWSGPVILILPGQRGADRDGWSVMAVGTTWQERSPYKELSSALVNKGFAVIRFDAPEVMPPAAKCRDTVRSEGLSDTVIAQHCLKMDVVQRTSLEMQIASAEYVMSHARKWLPGAKRQLVLLAIGDDVLQAAAIADRNKVPVHGLATIGGAASHAIESGQAVVKPSSTPAPIPNASQSVSDRMAEPIDVMVRRHIPGLFIWGELSNRLSPDLQSTFVAAASTSVSRQTQRIGGCYHLLSQRSDDDWMEPYMVGQVATTIREFVDKMVLVPEKKTANRRALTASLN